jgi:hypothetical protein
MDTFHTTALFRAGHQPATLLSARCLPSCLPSIAFRVVRIAETQRQHRSFKPDLPIRHSQLRDPRALTTSAIRRVTVKSP